MLVRPMLLQLNWDDQGFIDDGGASRAANVKSRILALLVSTIARLRLESKAANVNAGKPDWFAQITRTELADLVRFEVTKKLGDGFLKRVKKRLFYFNQHNIFIALSQFKFDVYEFSCQIG